MMRFGLACCATFADPNSGKISYNGDRVLELPEYDWVAEAYLAIDQGPQIIMIENYRTGLLWDLFMGNEDVQNGLTKLGF